MEGNKDIIRIHEIIEELRRDMKVDKTKINELELHVIKLQEQLTSLPQLIKEQNTIQTLEIEKKIGSIELQYSKGFVKNFVSFSIGIISAIVIAFILNK